MMATILSCAMLRRQAALRWSRHHFRGGRDRAVEQQVDRRCAAPPPRRRRAAGRAARASGLPRRARSCSAAPCVASVPLGVAEDAKVEEAREQTRPETAAPALRDRPLSCSRRPRSASRSSAGGGRDQGRGLEDAAQVVAVLESMGGQRARRSSASSASCAAGPRSCSRPSTSRITVRLTL